jgi:hypothetical protein
MQDHLLNIGVQGLDLGGFTAFLYGFNEREVIYDLMEQITGQRFHPSYTRMVPAHYVVEIQLVGCPDPDPAYTRFFTPEPNSLPADLDVIGRRYVGAVADEITKILQTKPQALYSALWAGDLVSFVDQASIYGLFQQTNLFAINMADYTTLTAVKNL